jgi:hypothetical protein
MLPPMRMRTLVLCLLAACGSSGGGQFEGAKTYEFGPFVLQPNDEINDQCVQITLDNDDYANVNIVELTTGKGFHHSNWFYVPEDRFTGLGPDQTVPDGTFKCDDRGFDQAIAALEGGVFFAQSTQTPHEIQKFPEGVAVRVPPHFKLVSQVHLLNATDAPITLKPNIKVTYLKDADVKTRLAGMSFQNAALALPPNMNSKFTVECDLGASHRMALNRAPDFKIYYALAHYHDLGTGLTVEAVTANGEAATVYTTTTAVGDTLGGPINPLFDFTGYEKVRFSCSYYNNRSSVVRWGVGDQEMCVFLAFTDSKYNFGGGVLQREEPQNAAMVGNTMTFQNPCPPVINGDADRG